MSKMIDDFKNTWLLIIRSPEDFFAQMPAKGGYTDPVKFAAINYLIAGLSSMIIHSLFFYLVTALTGNLTLDFISLAMGSARFFMIVIICFMGLFIGGGILHIFFRVSGGTGTYESTVRIIAYSSAAMAFGGIPFVAILAGLYLIYLVVVGGTQVHKVTPVSSVIAVLITGVVFSVLLIMLVVGIAFFLYSSGGLYGNSSVMSQYDYRIALNTDSTLENLTFYLPLPVSMNVSRMGEEAMIQNTGNPGWELSMIGTGHGTMLELTANELEPELHQLFEVKPPLPGQTGDRPAGEVASFTRGTIEISVSMEADSLIYTQDAAGKEPVLSPKYNMELSDYNAPYPSGGIPPNTWNYDSFIYADYSAAPNANVEICITMEGHNEWWTGGWTYNGYRDSICTTITGEQHGWIPVTGQLVEREGHYD
ncbi:MAG: YIP1 family protein [ANME-2 cluster archaeon]|nr:YIP1 family protein [ANME-2 cluster archaeon]